MSHNGIVRFFGYVQIDVAVGNSIIRVMTSPSMRLPDAGRGQRSRQRDRSGECYIEAAQHTNKRNKVTLSTSSGTTKTNSLYQNKGKTGELKGLGQGI